MYLKVLFALALVVHAKLAIADEDEDYFTKPSFDDYFDSDEERSEDKEDITGSDEPKLDEEKNRDNIKTKEQTEAATYEVTETVDDVPNTATIRGPIVPNFTLTVPLNKVTNNTNTSNSDNFKGPSLKKNSITIFHLKAEYDSDKAEPDVTVIQNNGPNFPNFKGFREYLRGVKQGIINGLHSLVSRDQTTVNPIPSPNINSVPQGNIIAAPIVFWDRLHSKSSDVAANVHRAIFGKNYKADV